MCPCDLDFLSSALETILRYARDAGRVHVNLGHFLVIDKQGTDRWDRASSWTERHMIIKCKNTVCKHSYEISHAETTQLVYNNNISKNFFAANH